MLRSAHACRHRATTYLSKAKAAPRRAIYAAAGPRCIARAHVRTCTQCAAHRCARVPSKAVSPAASSCSQSAAAVESSHCANNKCCVLIRTYTRITVIVQGQARRARVMNTPRPLRALRARGARLCAWHPARALPLAGSARLRRSVTAPNPTQPTRCKPGQNPLSRVPSDASTPQS